MCAPGGSGSWVTCKQLDLFGDRRRPHSSVADHVATEQVLIRSLDHLFGHGLAKRKIVRDIMFKVEHPDTPLILHFAGDNGVGKTHACNLISVALSTYCAATASSSHGQGEPCVHGDSMLMISGSSYPEEKWSISQIITHISALAAQHAQRFPHGMLVIDDLSAIPPKAVEGLMPLFGRGTFPDLPSFDPSKLLVIVTTDFGTEGRTRHMTPEELSIFIRKEFRNAFSKKSDSSVETIPFMAITRDEGALVVEYELKMTKCGARARGVVANVTFDDLVVELILEQERDKMILENGRALAKATSTVAAKALRSALTKESQRPVNLHFFVGEEGIDAMATPVDRPSSSSFGTDL